MIEYWELWKISLRYRKLSVWKWVRASLFLLLYDLTYEKRYGCNSLWCFSTLEKYKHTTQLTGENTVSDII